MLTDALAQFLSVKHWARLFLILGPTPQDRLYAEALRGSAKKFGLKIVAEKPWTFGALARAPGPSPCIPSQTTRVRHSDGAFLSRENLTVIGTRYHARGCPESRHYRLRGAGRGVGLLLTVRRRR